MKISDMDGNRNDMHTIVCFARFLCLFAVTGLMLIICNESLTEITVLSDTFCLC